MKTAKYFEIHDKDVTPEIYILLFCDAFVTLTGNDTWYKITPFGDGEFEDGWNQHISEYHDTEKCFKQYLERGYKNCYYDEPRMKNFCENPCTCAEAVRHCKKWLNNKGVTAKDTLFVKIYW